MALMQESRSLTDLAVKEANKFANKLDRLFETYNPLEIENQIFWRVLTRNLEVALEEVKNKIPEIIVNTVNIEMRSENRLR